jgi:hypothetical protein
MRRLGIVVVALLVTGAAVAYANHVPPDMFGHTTLEQDLAPEDQDGYTRLVRQDHAPDEQYVVRDGSSEGESLGDQASALPAAKPGRAGTRTDLAYFSQLTDFQLADEESPSRVEFVDPGATSAHRPQEALTPFEVDATVRQVNDYADASPVLPGTGPGRPMDFALVTTAPSATRRSGSGTCSTGRRCRSTSTPEAQIQSTTRRTCPDASRRPPSPT